MVKDIDFKVDMSQLDLLKLNKAATMLKAIAHPMRIAILNILNDKKMSVKQIQNYIKLEQSTTSHHLGILRDKEIVLYERKGKTTLYYVNHDQLKSILSCVNSCNVK